MITVVDCNGKPLDMRLSQVMGILNVTPDSFSDGGQAFALEDALGQARRMVMDGAAIIDVGGESTRPGAAEVSLQEELDRVIPVIEVLARELPVPVSIDTSKPEVMREAVAAGAGMINDVNALRAEGAVQAAADSRVPVCLMHMRGVPRTMQQSPEYGDVVAEVRSFLLERVEACEAAGIGRQQLLLDPGFGFGKTLEHNLKLMKALPELVAMGLPVLVGVSRKSMIGQILDAPVDQRMIGSVAAAVYAAMQGASIVRVHDVKQTWEALKVVQAIQEAGQD